MKQSYEDLQTRKGQLIEDMFELLMDCYDTIDAQQENISRLLSHYCATGCEKHANA
jgi:hypothetical protein